ncbi:hypothetical protein D3C86_1480110 [compost metagenome]
MGLWERHDRVRAERHVDLAEVEIAAETQLAGIVVAAVVVVHPAPEALLVELDTLVAGIPEQHGAGAAIANRQGFRLPPGGGRIEPDGARPGRAGSQVAEIGHGSSLRKGIDWHLAIDSTGTFSVRIARPRTMDHAGHGRPPNFSESAHIPGLECSLPSSTERFAFPVRWTFQLGVFRCKPWFCTAWAIFRASSPSPTPTPRTASGWWG